METMNASRTVAEVNDLLPDRVGEFVRARRFEGGGTSRAAMWVYEPDHTEIPSAWAVGLSLPWESAWLGVYRLNAAEEKYINLRTIVDEDDVGDDPLPEITGIAEAILEHVSEAENPDLLENIGVEDVEPCEVNYE